MYFPSFEWFCVCVCVYVCVFFFGFYLEDFLPSVAVLPYTPPYKFIKPQIEDYPSRQQCDPFKRNFKG